MKLIVGLGNPGLIYKKTRHNVGFMILDEYAKNNSFSFDKKKFEGIYAEKNVNNDKIIFLKPQKYMNLSGEVVKKYMDYFNINKEDLLVICDDLDTNLGKIKIKSKGSSGGHNGLKNIEENIGSIEYKRLKVGIKNDFPNKVDFVLGKFSKTEIKLLEAAIENSINAIDDYFIYTFENLMNKYN